VPAEDFYRDREGGNLGLKKFINDKGLLGRIGGVTTRIFWGKINPPGKILTGGLGSLQGKKGLAPSVQLRRL